MEQFIKVKSSYCFLYKMLLVLTLTFTAQGYGQAQELQQLSLNIEKLSQFKAILNDMKQGYKILTQGYKTVKDLSQGNFSLHKTFLDALLEVSPTVRKYKRIGSIINYQVTLMKESKKGLDRFVSSRQFSQSEIHYFDAVYSKLLQESLQNLDALLMIITAQKMRMTDDERIRAIDTIYRKMQDQMQFVQEFNNTNAVLILQRQKEQNDARKVQELYRFDP